MRAVFVGDRPSKHNLDPATPFLGTRSWDRLEEWGNRIGIDYYILRNQINLCMSDAELHRNPVIGLGVSACKALTKLGIEHFCAPHPSGLNRKLNNKKYVDRMLQRCEAWIKERQ